MDATFIYNLIQTIVFLAGFISIVVRFTNKMKSMEIDISYMKQKQKSHDDIQAEINAKLDSISATLIRVETKMEMQERAKQ